MIAVSTSPGGEVPRAVALVIGRTAGVAPATTTAASEEMQAAGAELV